MPNAFVSDLPAGFTSRNALDPPQESHCAASWAGMPAVVESDDLRIEWATSPTGRARKILSRSSAHRRYVVPCFRYGEREAHGDAEEEANAFILLDACAGVRFQEQPAKLEFVRNARLETHFPDICVFGNDLPEFWECKSDREALTFDVRHRAQVVTNLLAAVGIRYRLVTASDLQKASYLQNAKRLRRYSSIGELPSLARHDQRSRPCPARSVLDRTPAHSQLDHLLHRLYRGDLRTAMEHPLSLDVDVTFPGTDGERPWVWQLFE